MDEEMEDVSKAPLKRKIKLDEERISRLKDEYNLRFTFQYPKGPAASLPAKLSVSELYPSILDEMNDATKPLDASEKKRKIPTFYQSETVSAADRGIATHQFMQFCDFAELQNRGLDSEIHRLVERGFLDNETALRIDRSMLETFMRGELFSALCSAQDLMREVRFNVRLPAASFTEDPSLKASLSQETVLVQGIIDCLYTDSNGRLTLLDYKTDRIPQDMKASPYAFERFLIERHSRQLSYYRAACRYLFCRPVDRVLLYSFSLGRAIEVASDLLDEI
jgi:ATP-dependent helicase/nuclease subunit A